MLETFLNAKPLYYDKIDYTRMPRVYESVKEHIKLPRVIHLVGTNGKGTTGRFLASALLAQKHKVGHYTSPHILSFNERIWINGSDVSDAVLDKAHSELLLLLSREDADSLSYFEYTTLLAIYIFQDMDYVVLEAGLGGEYDATAVFKNILTLITPIDLDHEAFLGNDIASIATTKLKAVQKEAILGVQKHQEVEEVVQRLSKELGVTFVKHDIYLTLDDCEKIKQITKVNNLPSYLQENLSLAISALIKLGIDYEVEDFTSSRLFGRLTPLNENILLDVGHNALAAESIYNSLKGSKRVLIYNSFKDKDYYKILTILKPIIKEVEIIKIEDERAESLEIMEESLDKIGIKYQNFEKLRDDEKYLVFGSFSVAESFLKVYNE
ncbi:MAG: bifunctional folylpolyglutamate synthase/dihydrofolate synthase [Campylobacterota bacterium]|nr:bifunctional folylpolyglutamate synthase/dihydrofolate synthase [Campylobacterota bacterium]